MKDVDARQPSTQRLGYLDGLRGIAALLVTQDHFFGVFLPMVEPQGGFLTHLLKETPARILLNGNFCVFIFFVLSGFVLSESASKTTGTFLGQVVSRYFRLTVPMLASLIWAWLLLCLFPRSLTEFVRVYPNSWLQSDFYGVDFPGLSKVLADGFYDVYWYGHSLFNGVVWTMRKELLGSLVIYLIYCFVAKRFLGRALLLFGGVTVFGPIYLGFPLGAGLREAWAKGWLFDRRWAWGALLLGLIVANNDGAILFSIPVESDNPTVRSHFSYHSFIYSIAAALVVFSVLTLPALRRVLSRPVPRFLGRISFALYLVHLPLLTSVCTWMALRLPGTDYTRMGLLWLIFMLASLALSWLMTATLDEPLMARLKYLKNLRLSGLIPKKELS